MLRHSAGAITTMLGVVLVPAIMPAFLMMSESMRTIGEKMQEYNAPNALARVLPARHGERPRRCAARPARGVTAAAFVGAFVLLERRDV